MRLKRLDLTAFGPFTGKSLVFDSKGPGLNVMFGANEAGKSSSLRALKSLLYGIPERTPDNFLHPNNQLLLGGCVKADDGKELLFLRRKRRKTSLFDDQDNPIAPEALAPFLGGIDQNEFETLYGIDHESLVQGGRDILAQKGEVGQALFSAGAGISSLREVLITLETDADELFRPRASTRKINRALAEYGKLQKDIRSAALSGREWAGVKQALHEIQAALAQIEQKRREKDAQRRQLERLKHALPQLALRQKYLEKRRDLGDIILLPDDFTERRKKAAENLQKARQNRITAQQRLESLVEKKGRISFSSTLLNQSQWIEDLYQKLGSHRKALKDRPRLEGIRIACKREAAALLRQLPTDLPLEKLERLRPFLGKRKALQTLASKYEALIQRRQQHEDQCRHLDAALKEIDQSLEKIPAVPETGGLVRAVKLARKSGDLDDSLLEKTRQLETRELHLLKGLSQLGLWTGNLEEARRRSLPLRETILRFVEDFRTCEAQLNAAYADRETLLKARGQILGNIQKLEYAGEVPTEAELLAARKRRDAQWQLIKKQWLKGNDATLEDVADTGHEDLPDVYERHVEVADRLSDRLRREADRVHEFAVLEADQVVNGESLKTLHETLQKHKTALAAIKREWKLLWEPGNISPLPPKEMLDWFDKFDKIRFAALELDNLEAEIKALKAKKETLQNELICAFNKIEKAKKIPIDTLESVLVFCETLLDNLENRKKERQKLLDRQTGLLKDSKSAEQHQDAARNALADWEKRWFESAVLFVKNEGTSEQTGSVIQPDEVNDILENLQGCFSKVKEATELHKRIAGIDRDAEDFHSEIQDLVKKVAPDLKAVQPEQAVLELQTLLKQHLEQKTLLQKYTREIDEANDDISRARQAIHLAEAETSDLRRIAQCTESDDLEELERRAREQRDLQTKISETETALLKSAEGFSIAQLETQSAALNPDELHGEIDALNRDIEKNLDPEIRRLSEALGEKKRELQQMDGSSRAAEAALSAQQTLAAIRRMSDHFIRLKVASTLLKQEIERYRRENQDPVLTIASRFFRQLTLDSFEGLRTDEDERGQPVLAGVRRQNQMIRVEGMSSGTRDQLYLALRLAALEKRREMGETMPFIVDDILVNFDDERSRATLKALAGLAAKTQIILFTHHEKIAEEAQALAGRTNIEVHYL